MTEMLKPVAISEALRRREMAILLPNHCHKVGAAIYTHSGVYGGFNIQNRSHKAYHAEEIAVLNCMLAGVRGQNVVGIVITFSDNAIEDLTFACGHCRQILWEFTKNPNLLISEITSDGKVLAEKTLGEMYPLPYPKE